MSTMMDNGKSSSLNGPRRYRRDDAFNMSASLVETYRGCSTEDQAEYLDEQSVIRRSFKDNHTNQAKGKAIRSLPQQTIQHTNRQQRRDPPGTVHSSGKSEFEAGIDMLNQLHQSSSPSSRNAVDDDNVTTISKASKNPYFVLGISQRASSRELYRTYKTRLKEAEQSGASDKAFRDVGNAYRRIQAEIQRQEARKERRKVERKDVADVKEKVQQKYDRRRQQSFSSSASSSSDEESDAKTRREFIDARLKDHRVLVQELFANNGGDNSSRRKNNKSASSNSSVSSRGQVTTLENSLQRQGLALAEMNLVPVEAGAMNINEQNETIQNSCFYLSLAASCLSGVNAFTKDPTTCTSERKMATLENEQKQLTMKLALQLKRAIEAAVLLVHPDWATSGLVGEEVQAFSDFLVYALDSDSVLSHWTIAVFDDESGFVDIYRGRHYGKIYPPTKRTMARQRVKTYDKDGHVVVHTTPHFQWKYKDCDRETKRANTLTLRYIPGHYQPLLPELTKMKNNRERKGNASHGRGGGLSERPALEDILATLEKCKVLHVVTDGRA